VVLMMALIVLVAMTLAGIALVRSVDTSNIIAGNLAFQQAATSAGDVGSEAAVTWLQANSANNNTMWGNTAAQGYYASCNLAVPGSCAPNFAGNQTWDTYWSAVLAANAVTVLPAPDPAGNTISYVIHRLCNGNGDPAAVDCAEPPAAGTTAASSRTSDKVALLYTAQRFYRITTRIAGPRNTVSYVQTIVAL
jgi:Tfp pilus assembly protein PilX